MIVSSAPRIHTINPPHLYEFAGMVGRHANGDKWQMNGHDYWQTPHSQPRNGLGGGVRAVTHLVIRA